MDKSKKQNPHAEFAREQSLERDKQNAVNSGKAYRLADGRLIQTEVARGYIRSVISTTLPPGEKATETIVKEVAAQVRKELPPCDEAVLDSLIRGELDSRAASR